MEKPLRDEKSGGKETDLTGSTPGKQAADTRITLCTGPDELAVEAANRVVEASKRAVAESGRFTVALSGGSTPHALYALLATKEYREQIDWSATHLFWSDERCVPPNDEESNFRMVDSTLLNPENGEPLEIPKANVHRIQAELNEAGAEVYTDEISDHFNLEQTETPRFDLMLLGMGTDGHIASIFPRSHTLDNNTSLAQLIYAEELDSWRITLTPRVVCGARNCLLLISGKEKAHILKRLFFDNNALHELPAKMLLQEGVNSQWLVDSEAYSKIKEVDAHR